MSEFAIRESRLLVLLTSNGLDEGGVSGYGGILKNAISQRVCLMREYT